MEKSKTPEEIRQSATMLINDALIIGLVILFFTALLTVFKVMSIVTLGKVFFFVVATFIGILGVTGFLLRKANRLKKQREAARRFQQLLEDTSEKELDWCAVPIAPKAQVQHN